MPLAVFDLDGTLVDTAPDLWASLNVCLASANLPPTRLDVVRPHAGHGARLMLEKAFEPHGVALAGGAMEEQLQRFLSHYEAHIADASRAFPGVLDALDRLAGDGFTLAVCTNKTERLSRLLLETLGLAGRFATICGADTFSGRKPDPVHLLGTIERAGSDPRRSVMIGDTATDTDAAIAAGVPSILVDFGYAPDPRARKDANIIIADYAELDGASCRRLIGAESD